MIPANGLKVFFYLNIFHLKSVREYPALPTIKIRKTNSCFV